MNARSGRLAAGTTALALDPAVSLATRPQAKDRSEAVARFCLAALPYSVFLYALATLVSMAGMEIFGTVAQLLGLTYLVCDPASARRQFLRFLTPADAFAFALFVVVAIGVVVTPPRGEPWIDVLGSARWTLLFFFTRVAVRLAWSDKSRSGLLAMTIVTGLVGTLGLVQYLTGVDVFNGFTRGLAPSFVTATGHVFYRSEGLLGFTMTFAHSMTMATSLVLAFALLGGWKSRFLIALSALCGVLGAIAIVGSLTRGAWISFACSILLMGLLAGGRCLLVAVGSLFAASGAIALVVPGVIERAGTILNLNFPSNAQRTALWHANWEMFKDNPIVGVGYGMNEAYVGPYLAKIGAVGVEAAHAHNNYLQFLSGTGVLGFLCYVGFSLYFLMISFRAWRGLGADKPWQRAFVLGAIGAQVALHIGGLTECNFKDAEVTHQFLLILAVVEAIYLGSVVSSQRKSAT